MRLGICVKNLTPSQLNYHIIKNVNEFLAENPTSDIICFADEDAAKCLPCNFAIMEMAEVWGYNNPIIATTLSTVQKVLNCPSAKQTVFYSWDLEWLRVERKNYRDFQSVYSDPRLKIIVRSQDHADIFEQCWNRKVDAIIDDFDLAKIQSVIQGE